MKAFTEEKSHTYYKASREVLFTHLHSFPQKFYSLPVSNPHAHKPLNTCVQKAWPGLLVYNMDECWMLSSSFPFLGFLVTRIRRLLCGNTFCTLQGHHLQQGGPLLTLAEFSFHKP